MLQHEAVQKWILRRAVAYALTALLLMPGVASASWQQQELPGMTSGKKIAVWGAVAGGAAVAAIIIFKKTRKKKPEVKSAQPQPSSAGVAAAHKRFFESYQPQYGRLDVR
jgi:hypothetical protein